MTADEYVKGIIDKYLLPVELDLITRITTVDSLIDIVKSWAGVCLHDVQVSGSRVKGTAISLGADLDLFISLKSTTSNTLREIYDSLFLYIKSKRIECRKQNVSIGVSYNNHDIDLVPGKKHSGNTTDHSIYKSKQDTWTQTNVNTHIRHVKSSGRIEEIVLLKIWRELHGLEFPSFYLELTVIDALTHKKKNNPAENFLTTLDYLSSDFAGKTIIDPANSNNRVSDDLNRDERGVIAKAAKNSRSQDKWEKIIW